MHTPGEMLNLVVLIVTGIRLGAWLSTARIGRIYALHLECFAKTAYAHLRFYLLFSKSNVPKAGHLTWKS
jgi:hypothetical protein